MCATLNKGYLRAANRGSNNLYGFLMKISHLLLKRNFLGLSFHCFIRLVNYLSSFSAL